MHTGKRIAAALLLSLTLCACGAPAQTGPAEASEPAAAPTSPPTPAPTPAPIASTLRVDAVDDLPDDFILGMDLSSVLAEEASGVRYRDYDGSERDVFQILAENGITHIRVRVWNDPRDAEGNGYGGGNCDVNTAAEIGRRAAAYGMRLIVDFHYSDFWADPGKQMPPKAWASMTAQQKADALHAFTCASLRTIADAGGHIAMVQIGNETNQYLCGEKDWDAIALLMQSGAGAVRETCPDALVALHFANPERAGAYADYARQLAQRGVDYDVFASSYYPYWHGTPENLSAVLTQIAEAYEKKVLVMETSYAYTAEDSDFSGNTIGEGSAVASPWPYTVQGQANALRAVIDAVAHTKNGIGVVYWEGAWISVGTRSWEENSALWEAYGSGWASSFAAQYDPADAGKYYGGCAVDNQALFAPDGTALESLKLFRLLRGGNAVPLAADALEDAALTVDLNADVVLPDSVEAIMNDNSRAPLPVRWDLSDADRAAMRSGGERTWTVTGEAGGLPARAFVTMVKYNYLVNGDFERGNLDGWVLTDLAGADQLYAERKKTDSLTGDWHMHFWSARKNSVEFTLEQTPEALPSGRYEFALSIMGGDGGETDIRAYVRRDGALVGEVPLTITSYGNWDCARIGDIDFTEGQTLTVGIYVRCEGSGNGAWGKIDDASLTAAAS